MQSPKVKESSGTNTPSADIAGIEASDKGAGLGVEALQPSEVNWLDPITQIPFVPWPSEEVIRRGALAQIQVMLDQGVDPDSAIAGSGGFNEEEGKPMDVVKVENGEGMIEELDKATAVVKGNRKMESDVAVPRERKEEKPRLFTGLDLYDPDAE